MENLDAIKLGELFEEYENILIESMKGETSYGQSLILDARHYARCFVEWAESKLNKETDNNEKVCSN